MTNVNQNVTLNGTVADDMQGKRLDQVAALLFADYSREQLKQWIASGELLVNGQQQKAKNRLKGGEQIRLNATLTAHGEDQPENIPLHIVYEDDSVLVVNKPAGLVVHPGAGNWTGTLVNGLLYHDNTLATLPRAGLVHRIDKDTTGLLVVAKNTAAQQHLSGQLQEKSVYRHYMALVVGEMTGEMRAGSIDAAIKRHPVERTKMSVQADGKPAISHYEVEQHFQGYTLVSVALETGRTHQIRVHMAHIGFPLVGDPVYGSRKQLASQATAEAKAAVLAFSRQALHAYELGFIHPHTGKDMLFTAELPDDMQGLIKVLEA